MTALVTDAIVLHAFDYLETSRILRLATRDAGVQSVLARGARRSKARFGSSLDLFAEGVAHIHSKPGRDLQTLANFELTRSRGGLAADLERFTAAAVLAELVLRFGSDDANAALFDALADTLDALGRVTADAARETALGGAWRIVAALGFAPSVDHCVTCGGEFDAGEDSVFNHATGGLLCGNCGRREPAGRVIPARARAALQRWLADAFTGPAEPMPELEARAHQRLLREFLHQHLADARPLRAFDVWQGSWGDVAT